MDFLPSFSSSFGEEEDWKGQEEMGQDEMGQDKEMGQDEMKEAAK